MRYSIRERICASLVLLSSFSALHGAEARPLKRTLSFSSGYLTNASNYAFSNSNRALSEFYDELGMGYAAGFDALADLDWSKRNRGWLFLINLLLPNSFLSHIQNIGFHEFGHFSRFRAFGYDPRFLNKRKPGLENGFKNPFAYTVYLFTRITGMSEATYRGKKLWQSKQTWMDTNTLSNTYNHGGERAVTNYLINHPNDPDVLQFRNNLLDGTLIISAAGVNNQMRFSGDLSNKIYQKNGHLTEMFPFIDGRIATMCYPVSDDDGNDMNAILDSYREKDFNLCKSQMNTANCVSLLGSASTYAYFYAWYNFIWDNGETHVPVPEWRGVRLPDVENYLLAQGLSYKIISGYRVNKNLDFPVSIEFVTRGEKGYEASLGGRYRLESLGDLEVGGYILFGQTLAGGVHVYKPLGSRFFVEGVVENMAYKSFYGQRNIPTLKDNFRNTSFLVRGGMTY